MEDDGEFGGAGAAPSPKEEAKMEEELELKQEEAAKVKLEGAARVKQEAREPPPPPAAPDGGVSAVLRNQGEPHVAIILVILPAMITILMITMILVMMIPILGQGEPLVEHYSSKIGVLQRWRIV